MMSDEARMLLAYLQEQRDAVLWKLEGLPERDQRMPRTPTGTNLLGLVKHLANIEFGYFGDAFGRPHGEHLEWYDEDGEDNADMYASADETPTEIVAFYRRAWAHTDATVAELPLDAPGRVPWWGPERGQVTLRRILVHVIVDTARHAGQADILREGVDGASGYLPERGSLPELGGTGWAAYVDKLTRLAMKAE